MNDIQSGYQRKTTQFLGYETAYWEAGKGSPLLLMHGSGPGASALGSWKDLLGPLAETFHVIAYDLIGFGQSARKSNRPYFDSQLWLGQAAHMTALFGTAAVNVLGHSASASIALKLAATASTTVRKVVTTGALGAEGSKVSEFTVRGWTAPATDEELKDSLSVPFYEPSLASEAYARRRGSFADPEYRSYYDAMFEGDKQQYLEQLVIPARELSLVECEAMLVHGRHDKIAGYEQSLLISQLIRKADVAILGQCGHAVAAERPKFLMDIIRSFCA